MIEVKDLKKTFIAEAMFSGEKETVTAVDGVTFSVSKGEILALVGESGSGKTTIARCVAGLETRDSGEILINGEKTKYDVPGERRKVQYVFQDTFGSLNPRMKVAEAIKEPIAFHFGLKGEELKAASRGYLEMTGLKDDIGDKYPHEISGGQRQRVVLARALSMKPEVLIADEPVSSLDVSVQAQILSLLMELNDKQGITMLFITHDLRIVKSLAHRVIILRRGRIEEQGVVEAVYGAPKSDYTKLLLSSIPDSPYKEIIK